MMRYLPFIIISIVFYALFFYKNQKPDLLTAIVTAEKVIPLDFKKLTEAEKQLKNDFSIVAQHTEQSASQPKEIKAPENNALLAIQTIQKVAPLKSLALTNKNRMQQLQASIKSTPASDSALIKAELYEKSFYLQLQPPATVVITKKLTTSKKTRLNENITTKKKRASAQNITKKESVQDSAIVNLLKQTQSPRPISQVDAVANNNSHKPKRIFKKKATALEMANGYGLQQAISVSGNKPHYPPKAKTDKLQGAVTIKFTVNMRGRTKQPHIISSSGHQTLDAAVLDFIKKERFMPTLQGREKVTSEQQFFFDFSL